MSELYEYDLSGYVTYGQKITQTHNGKTYEIQKYQGEHNHEYSVVEVENHVEHGRGQLFRDGMLVRSWKKEKGKYVGNITLYKDGVVDRILILPNSTSRGKDSFHSPFVSIVNHPCGKRLLEERTDTKGIVIYRGGFNKSTLDREGYGIEYDEETGIEKQCGYYSKGNLIHLLQEFKQEEEGEMMDGENSRKKMKMIEYAGNANDNNVENIFNRRPIYSGGYLYDEKQLVFHRHGFGKELDVEGGICKFTGEWEHGKLIVRKDDLIGGWYSEGDHDHSFRFCVEPNGIEIKHSELGLSFSKFITELTIGNNYSKYSRFRFSAMELKLVDLPFLTCIRIGSSSFQHVSCFVMDNLNSLETVVIGESSFKMSGRIRENSTFRLTNCPSLHEVVLKDGSFADYTAFALSNVPGLRSIGLGKDSFSFVSEFVVKGTEGSFDRQPIRSSCPGDYCTEGKHLGILPSRCF